ncbi:MAG: hypothetical protein WBH85_01355 [Thermoanaerobaculia bacterium]
MILSKNSWTGALCTLLILTFVVACGGQQQPTEQASTPPDSAAGELPAGHPAVGETPSGMTVAPVPPGSGTGSTSLGWTSPAGWAAETPSSSMRRAQYRVPGEAGDAECVVFYFGPGEGGDAMANALRWADQFTQPDGRSSRELLQTSETDVGGIPVLMSEVTGTYGGGMPMMGQPAQVLPDHMLLGAVAAGPDANWFFKLTGPQATVEAEREAFAEMIRSLKSGA